jgi:hypothetical protein
MNAWVRILPSVQTRAELFIIVSGLGRGLGDVSLSADPRAPVTRVTLRLLCIRLKSMLMLMTWRDMTTHALVILQSFTKPHITIPKYPSKFFPDHSLTHRAYRLRVLELGAGTVH